MSKIEIIASKTAINISAEGISAIVIGVSIAIFILALAGIVYGWYSESK